MRAASSRARRRASVRARQPLPARQERRRGGHDRRSPCAARHAILTAMYLVPPERHLLRARDLVDARYAEPLGVDDLARTAGLSRAHFSREFRRVFGESPHAYLLTRRLERAAAPLRSPGPSRPSLCFAVGLR